MTIALMKGFKCGWSKVASLGFSQNTVTGGGAD